LPAAAHAAPAAAPPLAPSPAAPPVAPVGLASAPKPVSPRPPEVTTAMSPISSPDVVTHVRETVHEAVDQALATVRAGQRELESRLVRLEAALRDLQLSDQARAATFSSTVGVQHPAVPPVRAHLPTLPMGAPLPAAGNVTAVMPAMAAPVPSPAAAPVPPAAPLVAAPPASPVVVATPQAPAAAPAYVVRAPVPTYTPQYTTHDDEPFDMSMLPGGLDGRRRKRVIGFVALALLVVGVGGLAVMAIASQAVHGL